MWLILSILPLTAIWGKASEAQLYCSRDAYTSCNHPHTTQGGLYESLLGWNLWLYWNVLILFMQSICSPPPWLYLKNVKRTNTQRQLWCSPLLSFVSTVGSSSLEKQSCTCTLTQPSFNLVQLSSVQSNLSSALLDGDLYRLTDCVATATLLLMKVTVSVSTHTPGVILVT